MKRFVTPIIAFAALSGATFAAVTPFSVSAGNDGFSGWSESLTSGDGGQNGSFTGGSTTIDDSGVAWGLYANSGQTAARIYDFGGILDPGQSVSIQISLGFVESAGVVGISLQNASAVNRFETYYRGGDATDAFKINDASGEENVSGPLTSYGSSNWPIDGNFQTITYTQLTGNAYAVSFGGTEVSNSDREVSSSDISQIRIFNFNAGTGDDHNQYFNNLSISGTPIPEPRAYAGLFGLLTLSLVFLRRHRHNQTD